MLLLGVFKLQPASKNTFSFQMAWVVLKSFDTKYNKLLLFYTKYLLCYGNMARLLHFKLKTDTYPEQFPLARA